MPTDTAASAPRRLTAWLAVVAALLTVLSLTGLARAAADAPPCTTTSVASGSWSDPATWDAAATPDGTADVCVSAGTTVTLDESAAVDSVTVQSGGTLTLPASAAPVLDVATESDIDAGGTLQVAGGQVGDGGSGSLSDDGSIVVTGTATIGVPLTITGSLTVNGGSLTVALPLTSSGAVAIDAGGTVTADEGFSQSGSGSSVTLTGASSELHVGSAGATVTAGTVSGNGSIIGTGGLTMQGGILQPGGGSGHSLTVTGPYTQDASATLTETLGGAAATSLTLDDAAALDGTLDVTPAGGSLTAGSTYPVLTAGGVVSGRFATEQRNGNPVLPDSPAGLDYVMQYPASGSVSLVAVGAPGAPQTLTVDPTYDGSVGQELTVSWQPPAATGGAALTGYHVTVTAPGGGTATYDAASSPYTLTGDDAGLQPAASYTVAVTADNGHFDSTPASTSESTWGPPGAPALSAFDGDTTDVTVAPPAATNGSGITDYQALASEIGGTPADALSATWSAVTATWPLGQLDAEKGYTISVRAENAYGWGPWSPAVTVLPAELSAPGSYAVTYGRKVSLSTTLTSGGSVVSGQTVQLWSVSGASSPQPVAAPTTNADGVATATVEPTENASYFWQLSDSVDAAAVQYWSQLSDAGTISVRPVIANTLSRATLKAPRAKHRVATVLLYGWLSPKDSGAVVKLQRVWLGFWKTTSTTAKVVRQKLPDGSTRVGFVLPIHVRRSTPRRLTSFRAFLPASDHFDNALGATVKLRIR